MIEKSIIEKSFRIAITKCSPKSRALDYYNKNKENFHENSYVGGRLYTEQNKLQQEVTYTEKEVSACSEYNGVGYEQINGKIYDTKDYRTLVEQGNLTKYDIVDLDNDILQLDSAIDRSPRLSDDTIFFRGGHWDVGMKVGEHGRWKGFTSISYSHDIADDFKYEERYMIRIYAPKGTKGVLQTDQFDAIGENEFTLGRNQKYVVLDVDDENHTAEILLY